MVLKTEDIYIVFFKGCSLKAGPLSCVGVSQYINRKLFWPQLAFTLSKFVYPFHTNNLFLFFCFLVRVWLITISCFSKSFECEGAAAKTLE